MSEERKRSVGKGIKRIKLNLSGCTVIYDPG